MIRSFIAITILLTLATAQEVIPVRDPNNITLTFGSCNELHGGEPADIFYRIAEMKPDTFIWLGDVLYLDKGSPLAIFQSQPNFFVPDSIPVVQEKYKKLLERPEYKTLLNSTKVVGVWDDHDYGINNGDKYFAQKDQFRHLWLDFIGESLNSPRRTNNGLYVSYYLGGPDKVHVILLDVRYARDTKREGVDVLGEQQWAWLEDEFKNSKAEYIVVGTGSQFLPDDRFIPETWYAPSRDRFSALIRKYKKSGVILITGDVHFAEIMKYPCKTEVGYTLYELTSSGLTHYCGTHLPFFINWIQTMFPNTYNDDSKKYFERNFGLLNFDFTQKGKYEGVLMQIINYYGHLGLEQFVPKKEITFDEQLTEQKETCEVRSIKPWKRAFNHWVMRIKERDIYTLMPIICLFGGLFAIYSLVRLVILILRKITGRKSEEKQKIE